MTETVLTSPQAKYLPWSMLLQIYLAYSFHVVTLKCRNKISYALTENNFIKALNKKILSPKSLLWH